MLATKKTMGWYSYEFVSLSGKLWVSDSPYDFELDNYLQENEKLYVVNCPVSYETKIGNTEVIIDSIEFSSGFDAKRVVDILREFSRKLAAVDSNAEKILFKDNEITIQSNGEEKNFAFEYVLKDKRKNHPDIYFIDKETFEKYSKVYRKFQKSRTDLRDNIKSKKVIAFGKYFIVPLIYPVVLDIENIMATDDPIWYSFEAVSCARIIQSCHESRKKTIDTIETYTIGSMTVHSPQKIPKNAFIIDVLPIFLQFTKSGIVVSKGIFFAREQLDKTKHPCYIVEKTEDGWDIYVALSSKYDGHYRIKGNTLIKSPEKNKYKEIQNALYINFNPIKIDAETNELVDGFKNRTSYNDVIDRVKVVIDGKTLYAPKKIIKSCLFVPL